MLSSIIGFSIRNKLIVGLMLAGLIAYGSYSVTKLPIDAVPDITNNQVMIITTSPALGAADIERLITFPIEQNTRNIPGIIEQRSFSRFGLSLVTIVFDDETDIYWARQQVSEKLVQVQSEIPAGLGVPAMGPVSTGLGEIFQYVIRPEPGFESKFDATALRTVQDWVVRRQLMGTEGVADVSSFGGKLRQYEIALNTDKLKAFGLTISDVFRSLEQNNQNTGGAYIEKGPAVLYIRTEGLLKSEEEIGAIPVTYTETGSPVLVRDVGQVQTGAATRYGAMCYNDQGEVAGGIVMMLKGANSSQVILKVKEKIAQIQESLPEGLVIEAFLDRTKMVDNALHTVFTNLAEGALIVIFILVLFLGNIRAGLLVASVIPLAMLFAVIMMNLFGVSGNLMSLGALDFGLIVDGTVIIVEAIMHRLHHNGQLHGLPRITQQQMDEEVSYSTGKIMKSAAFGQLIILIVYLPFFALQGIEGKMFKPMAQTVAFAIIGAFLLSVTYIPMMSSLVLSKKTGTKKTIADRMMAFVQKRYRPLLEKVLRIPRTAILVSIVLFAVSVFILGRMGGEFIPELEEGDFAVDTRVLTGSSLTTTIKATQQTSAILLHRFPEVEKVVTKIGSGEIPTDPMPMEASDMMVILKPKSEWTSASSFDELAEKMSQAVSEVPGVTTGFQFPVQMRFNELITGARQDVVCKIFGEDLDTLARYSALLGEIAGTVEGAKDLYVEAVTGLPQIEVNYNRSALARYGIPVEEVNRTLEAAFAGAVCGQVFENERRFDIAVRMETGSRRDIGDVKNLLVPTRSGEQVQLRQLADVSIKVGPNQIQRENAQRRITVGFNVRGRDVQSVVKELEAKVKAKLKFPAGYSITYGGQFENLVAAKKRLGIAVPVALLLILLLLYLAFSSVKQGLLIYSAIPLAAIGGIFTLWLSGMPFSISAGVGFIALFGVAVLNGIVLISEFNLLKKNGMADTHERIITGTRTLLRPVLMTAAVAAFGFLPMALSRGAGAEVQRPLATVVIGGLITATFLTLFVLPVLYLLFERERGESKRPSIFQRMKKKKQTPPPAGILLVVLLLTAVAAPSQTISLKAALDSALRNNLSLQAARLKTEASKAGEKTAWALPKTEAQFEYGQFNSFSRDNRFGISQQLEFPLVYSREKQLRMAETKISAGSEEQLRLEVKKRVTELFYAMRVMQERKKLLQHADSLFAGFLRRQEERFKSGASDVLEKTAAESQRSQVGSQLRRLEADLQVLQLAFAQELNTRTLFLPEAAPVLLEAPALADTAALRSHPTVKLAALKTDLARRDLGLARTALLPHLSVGYANQSIIGWQTVDNTDRYFGPSQRFSSVQLGLGIPLFFGSGTAKQRSARLSFAAAKTEYDETYRRQQTEQWQLQSRLPAVQANISYYTGTALPQSATLESNASLQLENGAIGYLEWMMLSEQAIRIRIAYLDAVDEWNATMIGLLAISNQL